jgi:hypothetical protein
MIVAALAAVGLAGAACADNSPQAGESSAPPASAAADETQQICAQAMAEGTAAAGEFNTKINEMLQAAATGDTAKATDIESQLRQRLDAWKTKLTEWSGKNVKPQVKTALTEAAGTVGQLNDPADNTAVDDVKAKFTEIGVKLAAACAA